MNHVDLGEEQSRSGKEEQRPWGHWALGMYESQQRALCVPQ